MRNKIILLITVFLLCATIIYGQEIVGNLAITRAPVEGVVNGTIDLVVIGKDPHIVWEYKLMKFEGSKNPENELNRLGIDGWRIIPDIYYGFGGRMKFLMIRPVFPDEEK